MYNNIIHTQYRVKTHICTSIAYRYVRRTYYTVIQLCTISAIDELFFSVVNKITGSGIFWSLEIVSTSAVWKFHTHWVWNGVTHNTLSLFHCCCFVCVVLPVSIYLSTNYCTYFLVCLKKWRFHHVRYPIVNYNDVRDGSLKHCQSEVANFTIAL